MRPTLLADYRDLMAAGATQITLMGLSRLEAHELGALPGWETVRVVRDEDPGDFGDVTTIAAIVVLGQAALRTLAAWLISSRSKVAVKQTIEVQRPDGTRERHTLELQTIDTEAAAYEKLRDLMGSGEKPPSDE
jgi:hypothetical protein